MFRRSFPYDIYTAKNGKDARRCFTILADTLAKEHIDPSLYLKVLCQYGTFRKFMPPPTWLKKDKALRVFDWLIERERSRFVRHKDWKKHLNEGDLENPAYMTKSIKKSWVIVKEVMDNFGLNIGESALLQADRLSPWFLAMCVSFRTLDGMDLLNRKDREIVQKCFDYIVYHKHTAKEALSAYSRLE